MIIGALKTTSPTDKRSVLHPETISSIVNLEGVKVIFESGIGQGINVSDSEFEKNNLTPVSRHNCLSEADLLIVPSALSSEEVQALKKNSIVLGMIDPFGNKEHLKMLETCIRIQSKIDVGKMHAQSIQNDAEIYPKWAPKKEPQMGPQLGSK